MREIDEWTEQLHCIVELAAHPQIEAGLRLLAEIRGQPLRGARWLRHRVLDPASDRIAGADLLACELVEDRPQQAARVGRTVARVDLEDDAVFLGTRDVGEDEENYNDVANHTHRIVRWYHGLRNAET